MKEVNKEVFYNTVGRLDIVQHFITEFPYTTEIKLRNGKMVGKIVDSWTDGIANKRPITTKYYSFI